MGNVTVTLENNLAGSYKTEHTLIILPSNQMPGHLSREMKTCSHKNYSIVFIRSSFILSIPKLVTTHIFFSWRMVEPGVVHLKWNIINSKSNDFILHATGMNLKVITLTEKASPKMIPFISQNS